VAWHATIIPRVGAAVAVTPPFRAFGGMPDHATITFSGGARSDMRDHTGQYFFQAALACEHQISNEKSLHIDYDWKSLHIDYDWKSLHID
jgi:hypothetical protein